MGVVCEFEFLQCVFVVQRLLLVFVVKSSTVSHLVFAHVL